LNLGVGEGPPSASPVGGVVDLVHLGQRVPVDPLFLERPRQEAFDRRGDVVQGPRSGFVGLSLGQMLHEVAALGILKPGPSAGFTYQLQVQPGIADVLLGQLAGPQLPNVVIDVGHPRPAPLFGKLADQPQGFQASLGNAGQLLGLRRFACVHPVNGILE